MQLLSSFAGKHSLGGRPGAAVRNDTQRPNRRVTAFDPCFPVKSECRLTHPKGGTGGTPPANFGDFPSLESHPPEAGHAKIRAKITWKMALAVDGKQAGGNPGITSGLSPPYSSSSFNTAINASVGICTLPRERIFFLPSFCFSSSFFFRVMSPP